MSTRAQRWPNMQHQLMHHAALALLCHPYGESLHTVVQAAFVGRRTLADRQTNATCWLKLIVANGRYRSVFEERKAGKISPRPHQATELTKRESMGRLGLTRQTARLVEFSHWNARASARKGPERFKEILIIKLYNQFGACMLIPYIIPSTRSSLGHLKVLQLPNFNHAIMHSPRKENSPKTWRRYQAPFTINSLPNPIDLSRSKLFPDVSQF